MQSENFKWSIHLSSYLLLLNKSLKTKLVQTIQACPTCFSEVGFTTLLYKRTTLVPDFPNRRNSEKNFYLYNKRPRVKTAFCFCFSGSSLEAGGTPQWEWSCELFPQELHSASSPTDLNCIYEHLCVNSIYVVQLLARCTQKSLRELLRLLGYS